MCINICLKTEDDNLYEKFLRGINSFCGDDFLLSTQKINIVLEKSDSKPYRGVAIVDDAKDRYLTEAVSSVASENVSTRDKMHIAAVFGGGSSQYPNIEDFDNEDFAALIHYIIIQYCHRIHRKAIVFRTERFYCKEIDGSDFEALICAGFEHFKSREEIDGYYKAIYPFYQIGLLGMYECDSECDSDFDCNCDELIGVCGIEFPKGVPEVSYYIRKEKRGVGYATEAVRALLAYNERVLQFDEIYARIDNNNLESLRVIEKCNFIKQQSSKIKAEKDVLVFRKEMTYGN